MNRLGLAFLGTILASSLAVAQQPAPHSVVPRGGFVPDERTAVRIAEAVWGPIYGEEAIARQRPIKAVLKGEVWVVTGSLPPGWLGGVAIAELSKRDARILRVSHDR